MGSCINLLLCMVVEAPPGSTSVLLLHACRRLWAICGCTMSIRRCVSFLSMHNGAHIHEVAFHTTCSCLTGPCFVSLPCRDSFVYVAISAHAVKGVSVLLLRNAC